MSDLYNYWLNLNQSEREAFAAESHTNGCEMSNVDHLTDIFMDVSQGAESTTEQQDEQRGSWRPSRSDDTDTNIRKLDLATLSYAR